MKIAKLELENVKRVRAVTLEPKLNGLTIIGGRNGQGKTSVLDAIAWALGGEKFRPSSPAREDSVLPPRLEIHLDNGIVVLREGKNSALKVIDPSGRRAGQQLLDSFVEKLALDLPRFMEAPPKTKAETLLKVIGMEDEVRALDEEEQRLYTRRHALGQIADQKRKYAAGLVDVPDAPSEFLSAADLIHRQQEILARNAENARRRLDLDARKARHDSLLERRKALEEQMETLSREIAASEEAFLQEAAAVNALRDEPTEDLERQIRHVEELNTGVRAHLDKVKAEEDAEAAADEYTALSLQLENVRSRRQSLLDSASLPLPDLSVSQGELLYKGKAWDCMSASEQIRVSAAIVRALNPDCRFILLDKMEQLDLETLEDFGRWLEQEGLQAICTRVSTGSECEIIITDGVAESAPAEPEAHSWKAGEF